MKYTFAAAALFTSVFAQGYCPAPQPTPTPTPQVEYFSVISARSASPIHFLPLQANGGRFFLGGEPSASCPDGVGACPPGNITSLIGGDGSLSLGSIVPQQVYVAIDGTLSYTGTDGAPLPAGAIANMFEKTDPEGSTLGTLSYDTGFLACPQTDGRYQVYGQRDGVSFVGTCLGFSAITSDVDGPTAYQY
ncbi:hypothetical protein P153DRAFT_362229 [Dothidotthia symphoricarpi CBS 119687]|uniref:Cell wall protein PhiA n=1 Tax=Dothidotthia symphoricarpi CBS 119687 TaxID=1392245 RepID=A0A6A6AR98_9PLEO|nr:uncharacterized protein P153DRAFT_362229 [Dothidotthia symphoricarpi CBS 119687]KAF2134459.1 hypothetical protein P153DRAFT_362229 [Dothidotthia symphoricarpi CBS 119687]